MDEMAFLQPVHVGDIVRTMAQVNWAGRAPMEIGVRVESERWDEAGESGCIVASAYLVFVAIDEHGHPREIPGLLAETPSERRRQREAEIRRSTGWRAARRSSAEGTPPARRDGCVACDW